MTSLRDELSKRNTADERDKLVNRIKNDYAANGKHKTLKTDHKNIMLIGRTRTGKSTIKRLLVDPTEVPEELKLKSGTRDPLFESFHIEDKKIVLNIIDTPGLFERGGNQDEIRDNQAIMRTIQMCINMEITKFHVIAFCIALTAGINSEDILSLKELIKYFGGDLTNNSCLIITHCESKNEEQRNKLKEELLNDNFFGGIGTFFKLGVFFSGSISRDDFNNANTNMLNQYVTISDYRDSLIKLFVKEIRPYPVCEMLMNRLRQNQNNSTSKLDEVRSKRIAEHQRIIDQLKTVPAQNEDELNKLLEDFRQAVIREENADEERKYYMEGYENLLRVMERNS